MNKAYCVEILFKPSLSSYMSITNSLIVKYLEKFLLIFMVRSYIRGQCTCIFISQRPTLICACVCPIPSDIDPYTALCTSVAYLINNCLAVIMCIVVHVAYICNNKHIFEIDFSYLLS